MISIKLLERSAYTRFINKVVIDDNDYCGVKFIYMMKNQAFLPAVKSSHNQQVFKCHFSESLRTGERSLNKREHLICMTVAGLSNYKVQVADGEHGS